MTSADMVAFLDDLRDGEPSACERCPETDHEGRRCQLEEGHGAYGGACGACRFEGEEE